MTLLVRFLAEIIVVTYVSWRLINAYINRKWPIL